MAEPADDLRALGVEDGDPAIGGLQDVERVAQVVVGPDGLRQVHMVTDESLIVRAIGEGVGDGTGGDDAAVSSLVVQDG